MLVLLTLSVVSMSSQFGRINEITKQATGHDAIKLISGQMPQVKGAVDSDDPTRSDVEYAKSLGLGTSSNDDGVASLTLFPSNESMTPEQRAKLIAEAEQMRPKVPDERERKRR